MKKQTFITLSILLCILIGCSHDSKMADKYLALQGVVYDSMQKYHGLAMNTAGTDSFYFYHNKSWFYTQEVWRYADSVYKYTGFDK